MLDSLRRNDGIPKLMDFIYYSTLSINGFDSVSHFLRAGLIVNTCSTYTVTPQDECLSKFAPVAGATSAADERRRGRHPPAHGGGPARCRPEAGAGRGAGEGEGDPRPAGVRHTRGDRHAGGDAAGHARAGGRARRRDPGRPGLPARERRRMRTRGSSVASNPVLIGAVTILVVLVAVFLAYNANSGLPFVPTYKLRLDVPSGANLVAGNEVRIGGARVGTVSDIGVRTTEDGHVNAVLELKLDADQKPLPKDSTFIVRPKSLLGLKYVEITRGTSKQGWPEGARVPLSASRPAQVEFDELIDTFDKPTRDAVATNTTGFGTALAGRGGDLNTAIGAFLPLVRDLQPVAAYLHDDKTGLSRFIRAAGRTAAAVAPVAERQASLFVGADRTFSAFAAVARPYIQEAIEEGPATLDQSISSLRHQRPFLRNSTGLFRELRPGIRALADASPAVAGAFRAGRPTLLRSVALDRRLERVLTALKDFAEDPLVPRGVADLRNTVTTLRPTLDFAAPAQTTCNYLGNFFENVSDLLSVGDAAGNWQRFIIIATPSGPNSETGPSSAPADGPGVDNHLHVNPYPNTAAPGQPRECEAANEPYLSGRTVIGNVPGTQQAATDGVR